MLGSGVPSRLRLVTFERELGPRPEGSAPGKVRPSCSGTTRQVVPSEKWPPGLGAITTWALIHARGWPLLDVRWGLHGGHLGLPGASRTYPQQGHLTTWPRKLVMGVPRKTFKFGLISVKPLRASGACPKLTWTWTLGTKQVCWNLHEHAFPWEVWQEEPPHLHPSLKRSQLRTTKSTSQTFLNSEKSGFQFNQQCPKSAFYWCEEGWGGWELKKYLSVPDEHVI